jgi:hypothetical protein
MSPKPGTKVTLIAVSLVADAAEADNATTGSATSIEVETMEKKKGKVDSVKATPFKPPQTQEEKEEKNSWVEIELVDDNDEPVPGARYRVTLPDGSVDEGTLDAKGFARVAGFEPGACKVEFPDFDGEIWDKA